MDISAAPVAAVSDAAVKRTIVHAALAIAERAGSWDAVHVHDVAREAGMTLSELRRFVGDKDQIAEAFFDFADEAMLATADATDWRRLDTRERLHRALMAWLDALAPHRRAVRAMLGYKLHPEHIHLQVRGVMRISRTVQWLRETAMFPSTGWRREVEEAVLTTIYLTTFAHWMVDASPHSERTRRRLQAVLARAARGAKWLAPR